VTEIAAVLTGSTAVSAETVWTILEAEPVRRPVSVGTLECSTRYDRVEPAVGESCDVSDNGAPL
jgi:hypothetical protein